MEVGLVLGLWRGVDAARHLQLQLTSDGHRAYLDAVEEVFGADVDDAQLVKIYGEAPEAFRDRYSPSECIGALKVPV